MNFKFICTLETKDRKQIGYNVDAHSLIEAAEIIEKEHPDKTFVGCIVKRIKIKKTEHLC